MNVGISSSRSLHWLVDTSITALIFAAGVALLVSAAQRRSLLTWDAQLLDGRFDEIVWWGPGRSEVRQR